MSAFLREYKFTIQPNEKLEFGVRGDTLRVISSSAKLFFETKDGNSSFSLVEGEQAIFNDGAFYAIDIFHEQGAPVQIVLALSENASIGSAKISGIVTISSLPANNGAATQNRVSLTNVNQQILAAKATRKYLLIQNNDTSAVMRVTIDGNAATAAQGFKIPAGGTFEFESFNVTGAINAMMETATGAGGNVEFAEA